MMRIRALTIIISALFFVLGCKQENNTSNDKNNKGISNSAPKNYGDARRVLWNQLYGDGGHSLYCNTPFDYRENGFNVEHVMPMSWVKNELNCTTRKACRKRDDFNRIEADLHNLFITKTEVNSDRSSIPFGIIEGEKWRFKGCDYENNHRVVEPRPEVRGDIARSMFYMSSRYNIPLFPRQLSLLKEWNQADPISEAERRRNQRIALIQGNTNPFIDNADYINEAF